MRIAKATIGIVMMVGIVAAQDATLRPTHNTKIDLGADEVRLTMGSRGGRPVVDSLVNGKGPYRFYLDTGASGPVMGKKLATELGLPVIGEVGVKSGGDGPDKKPIAAKLVRIDTLELGKAKLSSVVIAAMDRAQLGGEDAPVGVLSPNMFPGYLVVLDYPKKEIRIRPGQLNSSDNKQIFAYLENRPIPSLMTKVGDHAMETHLDSGSGGGLSLPRNVAEKLPLHDAPRDTGKKARSISGEFPVYRAKLKGNLSFGQFHVADPEIDFSDVVRRGNLGAKILERFVVTIDSKNRRFQLEETN